MAAVNGSSVTMQKRKRRWFRFRFGLRTLLLFTAGVAVWLSFELRRAENQEALVGRVEAMGGQCQRLPREWIPRLMHGLLDESQGYYGDAIMLQAIQAPSQGKFGLPVGPGQREPLHPPSDIEGLLRLPGMDEVRNLNLSGTSMTDDILDELAEMDDLEAVTFTFTAVTEAGIQTFKASRPDCIVTYAAIGNGSSQLVFFHRQALSETRDLALFARAQRGEVEAIKGLLATCDHDEANYDIQKLQAKQRKQLEEFRRSIPAGAGLRPKELYDLLKERVVEGDLSALDILETFHYRSRFRPSRYLQDFLRGIESEAMRAPLADTLRTGQPEARFLAAKFLGDFGELKLLEEALGDAVSAVRIEAVLGLSGIGGPEAARCIAKACGDTDPRVRETAVRELSSVAGREQFPVYLAAAVDSDSEVRWQAVHALERYPCPDAVQPLVTALGDDSSLVRCAAARVLGKIGDPSAAGPLETATKDEDSFVREAAELALVAVGAESEE
jgi:HEAT repeat protein